MAKTERAIIHLLRHAQSTANSRGILAGRDNSVKLSERGEIQSQALADYLEKFTFAAIYSSPISRCIQTLAPYTSRRSRKIVKVRDLQEMDYGSWSGKKLKSLALRPLWKSIQKRPSSVRFPEGESFLEMNARTVSAIYELAKPGKEILICTHGDVIKSLLAHFSGEHLDTFQKWSVDPASMTTIAISDTSIKILKVNSTAYLKEESTGKSANSLGGGAGTKLRKTGSNR